MNSERVTHKPTPLYVVILLGSMYCFGGNMVPQINHCCLQCPEKCVTWCLVACFLGSQQRGDLAATTERKRRTDLQTPEWTGKMYTGHSYWHICVLILMQSKKILIFDIVSALSSVLQGYSVFFFEVLNLIVFTDGVSKCLDYLFIYFSC